jgi:catechol-2,3-dioxygenase
MSAVARLGHATFKTADISRMADYYSDVMGLRVVDRTTRRAIFGDRCGGEALILEQGSQAVCEDIAFAVNSADQLEALSKSLKAAGCSIERATDVTPRAKDARTFVDPKGTHVLIYVDAPVPAPLDDAPVGIGALRLGHIAFASDKTKAVTDFYVNELGFKVSDWVEDIFAFLRCGPDHHTVNFLANNTTRMHHIAYELKDWAQVLVACDVLGKRRIPIIWGPGRHRVGHNIFIYHRDPAGHVVELYAELDQMKSEALGYFEPRPWHEYAPQYPRVWSKEEGLPLWGLAPSDDFRRAGEAHLEARARQLA